MSHLQLSRPPSRRSPLGEATRRANNMQHPRSISSDDVLRFRHGSSKQDSHLQVPSIAPRCPLSQGDYYPPREVGRGESTNSSTPNPRIQTTSNDRAGTDSNRNSQISTVSTNASDGKRIKSCIGPWKLGKTLGKGATARVRLARHVYTGQEAAIKIVQKKHAQMSQAGSLASLDRAESTLPDTEHEMRRMPIGIEREVAIMKLIQHPNIMKLYDIWENRTEIYLVLEYVDNGELFEHITACGRLEEEEAMKYFRQILSAVGYCHSFNICHRDLKPENILLTKGGDIKIADFGMAALHQTPDHKLKTSCGSPHYAAPELIRGATYRGDKVDIWSMGVILYATLAGRLPFDVEGSGKDWISPLLMKIRKGSYDMAPEFSPDAANLIWRVLQVNPRDRIGLAQIWRHPVVRKYDYLDDFGGGKSATSPNMKNCGHPVLHRSEVSKELLRHLRSLWHKLSEQELLDALLSEKPNDQKLFYSLFLKYRDAQLENYIPDIEYSTSDYHHVRPLALTKTYSTRQFPQAKSKGPGRQISRFTVISNVAETEQSYDPFKSSRFQHLDAIRGTDRAKITIHRSRPTTIPQDKRIEELYETSQFSGASASALSGSSYGRYQMLVPPRAIASRSSLASSTRSRNSGRHIKAPIRYKRGVSFAYMRNRSGGNYACASGLAAGAHHSSYAGRDDDDADSPRSMTGSPGLTRYIRSRKGQSVVSQPLLSISGPARASQLWTDDVRQLSSSLARDCDEAFNRSSAISSNDPQRINSKTLACFDPIHLVKQPTTPTQAGPISASQREMHASLNNRPLPPPPVRSESVKIELIEARKQAELRKSTGEDGSPGYLDRMVSHIDRLIQPMSPGAAYTDYRASSAPVDSIHAPSIRPLPSICEAGKEEDSPRRPTDFDRYKDQHRRNESKASRIASAPEPRYSSQHHDPFVRAEPIIRNTIRVVNSPSPDEPVQIPAPLTIRKKSSQGGKLPPVDTIRNESDSDGKIPKHRDSGLELRQRYSSEAKPDAIPGLGRIDESDDRYANDSNSGTIVKKKSTWFKRNSKSSDEQEWKMSIGGGHAIHSQPSSNDTARQQQDPPLPFLPKKKGFSLGRLFKRRPSNNDMALGDKDMFDDSDEDLDEESPYQSHNKRRAKYEDLASRQIEPQRSWIAKLFNIKPAMKFICFSVSKRKSRHEIVKILRDWKRYGIRGVQVDKNRNIVFGRVAAKNYLNMKEVAFAGEVMTVIEHGRRSRLSIARFTQERGAASSFHKVVETLETVLKSRGMLVSDERKRRRMVKTLGSA